LWLKTIFQNGHLQEPCLTKRLTELSKFCVMEVFTLVGPLCKLHSDQGRNFESHILTDLCKAFDVVKSHTTPYHPMGDGLVERMNRSLLNFLRAFIEKEVNWEQHLQFLLYNYRTTKHSSTGLCPFEMGPILLHFTCLNFKPLPSLIQATMLPVCKQN